MAEENTQTTETKKSTGDAPEVQADTANKTTQKRGQSKEPGAKPESRKRNPRRPRRGGRREERARPEFDQKIISIRRVTRVMAGGRRFSFSVTMVAGNRRGKVGVGVGKAGDTQLAIEKAFRDAKKHMITIPLDKNHRVLHDVHAKFGSSVVSILPAPGRGLVAGSSVRTVLELGGVKDVTAKLFSRTKNKLNNARAAVKALSELQK